MREMIVARFLGWLFRQNTLTVLLFAFLGLHAFSVHYNATVARESLAEIAKMNHYAVDEAVAAFDRQQDRDVARTLRLENAHRAAMQRRLPPAQANQPPEKVAHK